MRTPKPGSQERPCKNGNTCEWYSMFGKVKTPGWECLDPDELTSFMKHPDGSTLPKDVRVCILCKRRDALIEWMNARRACGSMCIQWGFQEHYNFPEEDGEYCLYDMIVGSMTEEQGLEYPVVYHQRNKYKQVPLEGGMWKYEQIGYAYPEQVRASRRNFC
jgi:hypothetical protein